MLSLVMLAIVSAASPSSPAAPLKEIARVRSSAVCATLHDLVLPAARVSKDVRPLMVSLDGNVRTIAAVIKDMDAENGTGHDSAAAVFVSSLTTLPAANADWEAAQILVKLFDIDRLLLASYAKYPHGRSGAVDSLRQRVQNMVDLQRAYTNALRAGPAALSDNRTAAADDPFTREPAPAVEPDSPRHAEIDRRVVTYVPGRPLEAANLKFVPPWALAQASAAEESALIPAVLSATRDCDGAR